MSENLLEIRNLSKNFGSVAALNNISLDIKTNEMFALLGPSGCGKTTLLRIIAGFEYPDSGQVLMNQSDLLAIPTRTRPVNLMFQSYALFPHMDVFSNISYGLTNTSLSKEDISNQTFEIIEKIGLQDHVKKKPNQLSGGQQQRVALARAIARKPKILLLDEPLSALDKKIRQEMQIELKRIQHEFGITFIIVTHDQDEAISLANRIAVFDKGEIKQISTPQELYENPTNEFVANFIGDGNLLKATSTTTGFKHPALGEITVSHNYESGKQISFLIRPENISLVKVLDGSGEIVDSVFAGYRKNINIKLKNNEIVRVYADKSASLEIGDQVNLSFRPQDIRVF
ncbi:MAG: ABC transporter ATP-binding protein [Candidatus Nanopelagicales bacterium]|jgi:spermidine/putrescine transport system ATP-binding protein/putrescine transport system ATP-binding protein|nr:ABC transporter ATP-binding protein [Candidatus Nanopelagicales bacterium]